MTSMKCGGNGAITNEKSNYQYPFLLDSENRNELTDRPQLIIIPFALLFKLFFPNIRRAGINEKNNTRLI